MLFSISDDALLPRRQGSRGAGLCLKDGVNVTVERRDNSDENHPSEIIVRDYNVEGGYPQFSRTGDMIMKKGRRGWRVPPEFAGSHNNNFVTRATDSILLELGDYIQKTTENML